VLSVRQINPHGIGRSPFFADVRKGQLTDNELCGNVFEYGG